MRRRWSLRQALAWIVGHIYGWGAPSGWRCQACGALGREKPFGYDPKYCSNRLCRNWCPF